MSLNKAGWFSLLWELISRLLLLKKKEDEEKGQ